MAETGTVASLCEARKLTIVETTSFIRAYVEDPPSAFVAAHRRVGPTFAARIPRYRLVSTIDPPVVASVLRDSFGQFSKGRHGDFLAPLWGRSTVQVSDGPDWMRQRRVVAGFFHNSAADSYRKMVDARLPAFLELMDRHARSGEPVPLYHRIRDVYFRSLCDVWLGPLPDDEIDEVARLLRRATDFAAKRLLRLFATPLALPTGSNRAYLRAARDLHVFVEGLLARLDDGAKDTLVAALRAESRAGGSGGISQEEARNNLIVFLLAAYEFPSLGWALRHLGAHRDARDRIFAELTSAAGTEEPRATRTYLECCLMESLRLVTPSPMLARDVLSDSDAAGLHLRSGWTVVIPVVALHRHPALWSDPDAYRPERFLQPPAAWTYLPFGGGLRGCIGQTLTRQLDKAVLGRFFKQFDFSLVSQAEPRIHDRLKSYPEGGVLARIRRR